MAERTPGLLESAWSFIGAARSADGDLRAFYAARARLAINEAAAELDVLRLNLGHVEQALTTEAKNDG